MSDPDDDYIESSRAPLLEHLTELRNRLMICIVTLVVGFAVSFYFSGSILEFLLQPWEVAARMLAFTKANAHAHPFSLDLISGVLGFTKLPPADEGSVRLIATAALEVFLVKVKLAAFGAIVVTFPVIAWQLYRFVAPGLYKKERLAFAPFLVAAPLLFLAGATLVYKMMLPFVFWFGLSSGQLPNVTIETTPKIDSTLDIATKMVLAFGLCFQLPVVLSLLGLAGIVNAKMLRSFWRYAVVLIFLAAAIFTPPDPISQLSLAIPLVLLYEISIWCVKLMELRRRKADLEAEKEAAA